MIPPHERGAIDPTTNLVLRHPCWCGEVLTFEADETDSGERYVIPHTWHRHDLGMPMLVANGDGFGRAPA
jgi:hypothetical protein